MRVCVFIAVLGLGIAPLTAMSQAKRPTAAEAKVSAPVTQMNRNLLKNGNGEIEGKDDKDVAGWGPVDGLTGVEYGSVSGEWDWGLSGCAGCGKRYLRLQFEGSTHMLSAAQTINVTASADAIDKKTVTAAASAYLGGFLNSDTTSRVIVSFQDAAGTELGTLETKPYDTAQLQKAEKGSASLTQCQVSGLVPAGTRKIVYTWKADATGTSNDYLALGDDFSLVLTAP